MGTYAAPAIKVFTVDYVGDGTNNRVIDVGGRARFYSIFRLIDANRDAADLTGFDSAAWTFFQDGGAPLKNNESFITDRGINVGRIWWIQGGGNDFGVSFRIIAYVF